MSESMFDMEPLPKAPAVASPRAAAAVRTYQRVYLATGTRRLLLQGRLDLLLKLLEPSERASYYRGIRA